MAEQLRSSDAVEAQHNAPCAVVLGVCVHGLAVCRALNEQGIRVHALESNDSLPGVMTSAAAVHLVDDINSPQLVQSLVQLRPVFGPPEINPVLFPINDNMVRILAANLSQIVPHYRLSWDNDAETIADLVSKSGLLRRCRELDIRYPETLTVPAPDAPLSLPDAPAFIAKPARPLSQFKTFKFRSEGEFDEVRQKFADSFPILVQPWIEGDDTDIYFSALYLLKGRAVCHFEGRKVLSNPPAMGQTTAAVSFPNPAIRAITERFFAATGISGPVSMEFKQDRNGEYWVIEPTVGRTDYWIDCAIRNGVNLPFAEYQHLTKGEIGRCTQTRGSIWLDTEADPKLFLTIAGDSRKRRYLFNRPRFAFLSIKDHWPSYYGFRKLFERKLRQKDETRTPGLETSVSRQYVITGPTADNVGGSFFSTSLWFQELMVVMAKEGYNPLLLRDTEQNPHPLALPFIEKRRPLHRTGKCLSNYYSPRFYWHGAGVYRDYRKLICELMDRSVKLDDITFAPLDPDSEEFKALGDGLRQHGWLVQQFFCHKNWFLDSKGVKYSDYHKTLSSRIRSTIKRKESLLNRTKPWHMEIVTDPEGAAHATKEYERIYDSSWKKAEPYPEFIKNIAVAAACRGWLRMGMLYIDDTPAASQIWFVRDNVASIFKLAHDEAFRRYSPGTLLTNHLMKHVIDIDRVHEVDYLTGDDQYKRLWMSDYRERWGLKAFNVHTPMGLLLAAYNIGGHKLKHGLKKVVPVLW